MNYWYNDNFEKIIRWYVVENDKIIISYLDGSVENDLKYSEENEKNIIEIMIRQAEERNNYVSIENLKANAINNDIKLFLNIGIGYSGLTLAGINSLNNNIRLTGALMSIVLGLIALAKNKKSIIISNQINELEKYKLYLSMRKEIEDNYNKETFDGIKSFDGNFNINTLDDYSLDDVKKIKKNLDKKK